METTKRGARADHGWQRILRHDSPEVTWHKASKSIELSVSNVRVSKLKSQAPLCCIPHHEFEEAPEYYEKRRMGLGTEFSEEVGQALDRISHYPEAWSQLSSRIRRCLVNRFPYSVI